MYIFCSDTKKVYFFALVVYNESSKVDGSREVSHLGKGVNERAHLFCGAPSGPLPIVKQRLICLC